MANLPALFGGDGCGAEDVTGFVQAQALDIVGLDAVLQEHVEGLYKALFPHLPVPSIRFAENKRSGVLFAIILSLGESGKTQGKHYVRDYKT